MKKYILIFIVGITTLGVSAQSSIWKINWDMNAPVGQTADFVGKYSFRGVSLDAGWFIGENFALGGSLAWGLFYEKVGKVTELYHDADITITGKQQKWNNFVPVLVNAEYYFTSSTSAVRPYIGLGIGASWSEEVKNVGLYQFYDKNWMFTIAPEVGMIIPIAGSLNAHVRVRYLQGLWSEGNNLQSFTISIGFAIANYRD